MNIKLKSKAKTIEGKISAIIREHFIIDPEASGISVRDGSGDLGISLYYKDAAKMIMDMFDIKEKEVK